MPNNALLSPPLPDFLFHYTTQDGLLGILESDHLWLTSSRYLNDTSEFQVGLDVALRVIATRLELESDDNRREWLDEMRGQINDAGVNLCVCSFSEDGDSLSQWRAYSGPKTGYALGFESAAIEELAINSEHLLARCLYEPQEQQALMEWLVDKVLHHNDNELHGTPRATMYEEAFQIGGNFAHILNKFSLIFKHRSFANEREWRLISGPTSYEEMDYRPGLSTIIPYSNFALRPASAALPISQVTVGPTPHPEEAVSAVQGLMMKKMYRNIRPKVSPSAIPFRNW